MPALSPTAIRHADHASNRWSITLSEEITYEMLLDPMTWTHHSNRLGLKDSVEVWAEDMSWMADFRVLDKGAFGVKMGEVSGKKEFGLVTPDESLPGGYQIKWQGPALRFCIIRQSDAKRIHEGEPDKAAAAEWLRQFTRKAA